MIKDYNFKYHYVKKKNLYMENIQHLLSSLFKLKLKNYRFFYCYYRKS